MNALTEHYIAAEISIVSQGCRTHCQPAIDAVLASTMSNLKSLQGSTQQSLIIYYIRAVNRTEESAVDFTLCQSMDMSLHSMHIECIRADQILQHQQRLVPKPQYYIQTNQLQFSVTQAEVLQDLTWQAGSQHMNPPCFVTAPGLQLVMQSVVLQQQTTNVALSRSLSASTCE